MQIFAFGHHKEVGKDAFVKFCIDQLRYSGYKKKIVRRGFADNLYDICYTCYKWAGFQPRVYYQENPKAKADMLSTGSTVRETLIKVGNKFREYDNDVWINSALRGIDADILFITDLRFPNEFLHCKSVGGMCTRIDKPGLPEPTDEADIALNSFTDKWDAILNNDGDLQHLYTMATSFVKKYILKG